MGQQLRPVARPTNNRMPELGPKPRHSDRPWLLLISLCLLALGLGIFIGTALTQ